MSTTSRRSASRSRRRRARGRRWLRQRRRLGTLAVAVLSALVLALTLASLRAGTSSLSGPQPSIATLTPRPPAAAPLALPPDARVLIVGDSYTEGWGATPTSKGYAYLVGEPLGWRVTSDGVGSTGYTNSGLKKQGTYEQRVQKAPARKFDLVVLQGGSNDEGAKASDLELAVDATIHTAQQRYPTARIVLMGPVDPHGSGSSSRGAVNAVLTRYARAHSLPFVNPMGERWFKPQDAADLIGGPSSPAQGHPNNAGYARIAERFVEDIKRLSQPSTAALKTG